MSIRLISTALLAATLAACASYPSDSYRGRVVYEDGSYYSPADDGYGDYYYAPEREYGYDYYGYDHYGYGYGYYDYRYSLGPIGYLGYDGFCSARYRSCAPYWYGGYAYWPSYSRFGFSLSYGSGGWFDPWGYGSPYYGFGYHTSPIYHGGGWSNRPPRPQDRPPPPPSTPVGERPMPKPVVRRSSLPVTAPGPAGPPVWSDGEAAWTGAQAPRSRYVEPSARTTQPRTRYEESGARMPAPRARYVEPSVRPAQPRSRYEEPSARPAPRVRYEDPATGGGPPRSRYDMSAPEAARVRPPPKPAYQEGRPDAPPVRTAPPPRYEPREPARERPAWREERVTPAPASDGNEGAPRGRRRPEDNGDAGG